MNWTAAAIIAYIASVIAVRYIQAPRTAADRLGLGMNWWGVPRLAAFIVANLILLVSFVYLLIILAVFVGRLIG